MGSIPSEYLDDLQRAIIVTLNRVEQLRMRVIFNIQFLKGAYGQELEFRSDGNTYLDDVLLPGAGVTDHGALTGLTDDDHTQYLLISGSRAMSNDLNIGNNEINNCNKINMDAGFHPAAYINPVFTDPTYDLKIWGESEIMFFNGSLGSESESVSITTEHLDTHGNVIINVGTPSANTDAATKGYVNGARTNTGAQEAADHGAASIDQIINVCYGTSATPPTASDATEGALYIQYTA